MDIGTFFIYFFVIGLCVVVFFVMVILPIILTKQYYKDVNKAVKKHIRFETPYCSFIWEDSAEQGYEAEVDWEYNPSDDKTCGLYFDLDYSVTPPEGGYEAYVKSQLECGDDVELNLEKLIPQVPILEDIRPGKCYRKMEEILANKQRFDTEIREYIADYFIYRPELIEEGVTREELIDGINISYISVYKNGITEYSIYSADGIYVDDLDVIVKEDGTRDIQYKAFGT